MMRNISRSVFAALLFLMPIHAHAAGGTRASGFLTLDAGARASAMGGAFTAAADDTLSAYWNPAGLNRVEDIRLNFTHAIWIDGLSHQWAAFTLPLSEGVFAGALQYVSYGSFDERDETGLYTGSSFSPYDFMISGSLGRELAGMDAGITLKYISTRIKDTAFAFAADAGLAKNFYKDRVRAALSVKNLGTAVKGEHGEDPLPLTASLGLQWRESEGASLSFDARYHSGGCVTLHSGAELVREVREDMTGSLRIGYSTRNRETGSFSGITAGLGMLYREKYTIDYAFVPFGDLGATHSISLSYLYR